MEFFNKKIQTKIETKKFVSLLIVAVLLVGVFQANALKPALAENTGAIPSWIKNTAKWWAEGQVSDSDFTKGIQYLIQQDIITVPPAPASSKQSQTIPSWIKNTAKWWAEGQVSDSDFTKGIQYLVQNGIIVVHGNANQLGQQQNVLTSPVTDLSGQWQGSSTLSYIFNHSNPTTGKTDVLHCQLSAPTTLLLKQTGNVLEGSVNTNPSLTGGDPACKYFGFTPFSSPLTASISDSSFSGMAGPFAVKAQFTSDIITGTFGGTIDSIQENGSFSLSRVGGSVQTSQKITTGGSGGISGAATGGQGGGTNQPGTNQETGIQQPYDIGTVGWDADVSISYSKDDSLGHEYVEYTTKIVIPRGQYEGEGIATVNFSQHGGDYPWPNCNYKQNYTVKVTGGIHPTESDYVRFDVGSPEGAVKITGQCIAGGVSYPSEIEPTLLGIYTSEPFELKDGRIIEETKQVLMWTMHYKIVFHQTGQLPMQQLPDYPCSKPYDIMAYPEFHMVKYNEVAIYRIEITWPGCDNPVSLTPVFDEDIEPIYHMDRIQKRVFDLNLQTDNLSDGLHTFKVNAFAQGESRYSTYVTFSKAVPLSVEVHGAPSKPMIIGPP